MEREFSRGGREFKLAKIDAFKQFHIVRRVGPLLADLLPVLKAAKAPTEGMSQEEQLAQIAEFVAPIMNGLSKLSDADSEYVLFHLLQAVEMKQPTGNYARLSNGQMMLFDDFDFPTLVELAGRAFMFNLSGFFGALPQK